MWGANSRLRTQIEPIRKSRLQKKSPQLELTHIVNSPSPQEPRSCEARKCQPCRGKWCPWPPQPPGWAPPSPPPACRCGYSSSSCPCIPSLAPKPQNPATPTSLSARPLPLPSPQIMNWAQTTSMSHQSIDYNESLEAVNSMQVDWSMSSRPESVNSLSCGRLGSDRELSERRCCKRCSWIVGFISLR